MSSVYDSEAAPMKSQQRYRLNKARIMTMAIGMPIWMGRISQGSNSREKGIDNGY